MSLQCLISALTQAGGGGLLFRFTCWFALGGGRGTADRHRCVWGALTLFQPHWVCPHSRCVLPPPTLLRLPAALYGAGPVLRAVPVFRYSTKARTRLHLHLCLPRPEQLRQPGIWWAYSPWVRCAFSSPRSQPQFPQASPVRAACVYFGELASSRDPPGKCWPSRISRSLWLETGELFAVW